MLREIKTADSTAIDLNGILIDVFGAINGYALVFDAATGRFRPAAGAAGGGFGIFSPLFDLPGFVDFRSLPDCFGVMPTLDDGEAADQRSAERHQRR